MIDRPIVGLFLSRMEAIVYGFPNSLCLRAVVCSGARRPTPGAFLCKEHRKDRGIDASMNRTIVRLKFHSLSSQMRAYPQYYAALLCLSKSPE